MELLDSDLPFLAEDFGIVNMASFSGESFAMPRLGADAAKGFVGRLAMDAATAQSALVTTSNAGIPAFLSNYVEPNLIEVLTTPNKAALITGEGKKGDWTSDTAFFPVIESTGETSSYDDFSENGMSGANATWPQRQSYHFQTITNWGEKQLAKAALGRIDWAARLNIASAKNINKFFNRMYFFGIAGLQNYGILTDPSLSAALTPVTKTGGGTAWSNLALPTEIFEDIQALFAQLQTQTGGLLQMDAQMVLGMPPVTSVYLANLNQYGVTGFDALKKNYPNMRIETAVEYQTAAGNVMQLIAEEIEAGQETMTSAFTEKMRAHAIERKTSSFLQKKSAGGWGCIFFQPIAVAQMIGV